MSLEHQLQDLLTAVLSFTLAAPPRFSQLSSYPKEKGSSLLLSWEKKKKKKGVGGKAERGSNLPDLAQQISDRTFSPSLRACTFF